MTDEDSPTQEALQSHYASGYEDERLRQGAGSSSSSGRSD